MFINLVYSNNIKVKMFPYVFPGMKSSISTFYNKQILKHHYKKKNY